MSEPEKKGLGDLEQHAADKAREALIKDLAKKPTYVVKSALQVLKQKPEPPTELWGGICLNNSINEIIGQSGIGKSRIMLNLAVRQCLVDTKPEFDEKGEPILYEFAGHPLYRGAVKWLMIGSENGIHRYYTDLERMTKNCSQAQLEVLGKRLFMTTLEGEGDSYIALDEKRENGNFERLQALIAQILPDVVVFDPWGDVIGGSELDDHLVRTTIAHLRSLRVGIKDQMSIIIVNHARGGALENTKAVGLDAMNFGKNSKALIGISRCAWNLYYTEDDLASKEIGFYNVKRSDGDRYGDTAVEFIPERMEYKTTDVDPRKRLREMAGEAGSPAHNREDARAAKYEGAVKKAIETVQPLMTEKARAKSFLEGKLRSVGIPDRIIKSVFPLLEAEHGYQTAVDPFDGNKVYVGTPEGIAAFKAEIERKQAERLAEKQAAKAAEQPKRRGRPPKNKSAGEEAAEK